MLIDDNQYNVLLPKSEIIFATVTAMHRLKPEVIFICWSFFYFSRAACSRIV